MKVHVWGHDVEITAVLRAYVERRLGLALGRFGERIGQVTVRISSTDVDRSCRIDVSLRPRKLRIEGADADALRAVDYAAERVSSSLTRALEREREWDEHALWPEPLGRSKTFKD